MPINRPHFSDEDWADYVRGALPDERRSGLQDHLDASCASCTKVHATWRAVQDAASTATRYEPSAGSVRIAKALFGLHKPASPTSHAAELVRVLFDSNVMTAASGLRSGPAAASRKCVFLVGQFVVDVQIQDDERGRATQLIGQVTAPDGVDAELEGSPVLLLREMTVIARGTMNRLGEFHMQFDGFASGMSLALGLKHGGTVLTLDMTRTQS
jgi:hypothetical protein